MYKSRKAAVSEGRTNKKHNLNQKQEAQLLPTQLTLR